MRDTREEKQKSNKGIIHSIFFFSLLFLAMIGYMIYFIVWQAPDLMSNPYNARMDVFNNRYIRGSILSSDGKVLARTERSSDGEETRVYPYGSLFAHSVGYSTRGKTGLESSLNFYLMESHLNPLMQIVNELRETKTAGDDVVVSLDVGLQEVASNALAGRRGAIVCMEPSTGRILAMVSNPGFDPNTLNEEWENLISEENTSGNLVNRATQGQYPPGSTFKILMLLAYMREHPGNFSDFVYQCNGSIQDPNDISAVVHCYNGEVHGLVDLRTAFAESCNTTFSSMGMSIDKSRLRELTEELYFNTELPVPISSRKSSFTVTEDSSDWTMMQTAIGQGETLMSPIHLLMITSAIANDGVVREPVMADRIVTNAGTTVRTFSSGAEKRLLSQEEAAILKDYMIEVVNTGTASRLQTDRYQAAGKTGSAEYYEGSTRKTNAWFTGFAPAENPSIALTIIVEDGETGGRTAAPIAREILDYWLG